MNILVKILTFYSGASKKNCFTDLSFCFWLNLKNLRTSKIFDHQPKNKQGFGFTLQKDYGFLNLKNVDLLFDYNFFHVPNRCEMQYHCDNVILNKDNFQMETLLCRL